MAALEGKDWSASLPSEADNTGTNSGHSVVGATGQMQTRIAQMPTRLSQEKDPHLGGDDSEPCNGHEHEWEHIPECKCVLGDSDALLLEDCVPKQASEACREGEAHGTNVACNGEGDRYSMVAVWGKLPCTHDLCEEDHHTDAGSGDVAEDDIENANEPVAP